MTPRSSPAGADPIIRIEASKVVRQFQVLTGIDLRLRTGERIVVCGPSGSGKSTLIRCINRLETVQKGRIVVDGIELTGRRQATSTRCAPRSAWCSSSSTCSRTSRSCRTARWRRCARAA